MENSHTHPAAHIHTASTASKHYTPHAPMRLAASTSPDSSPRVRYPSSRSGSDDVACARLSLEAVECRGLVTDLDRLGVEGVALGDASTDGGAGDSDEGEAAEAVPSKLAADQKAELATEALYVEGSCLSV